MILYSITININKDVHEEWINWMTRHYVPLIMATGYFIDKKIMRLLNEEDNDGVTYSFQYFSANLDKLEEYKIKKEDPIVKILYDRYPNQFVEFRTMLEVLEF